VNEKKHWIKQLNSNNFMSFFGCGHCSTSELEDLLKDDKKLDDFCRKLPAIANISSVLDDTRKENLSLASMPSLPAPEYRTLKKMGDIFHFVLKTSVECANLLKFERLYAQDGTLRRRKSWLRRRSG
jgi:hypothetical protein